MGPLSTVADTVIGNGTTEATALLSGNLGGVIAFMVGITLISIVLYAVFRFTGRRG